MGPYVDLGIHLGHPVSLPALAALGLAAGFAAGMFGIGGGFILTPVLIYAFGIPPQFAVGSALCQKCGTSISSFFKYRKLGRGEPRMDYVMIGGSLMGVDAGTRVLSALTHLGNWTVFGHQVLAVQMTLDILFIVLLTYITYRTAKDAWEARKRTVPRGDLTIPGPLITRVRIPPYIALPNVGIESVSVPMLCFLGFVLGFLSGMMGIGGGVLFMPILLYGIGLSVRNAAGTGVLLLFVTVAVGTFEQALAGFVSLPLAMCILVGSSVGSQLGALTTHHLPNRTLRIVFSCLVAATVLMIAWDLVRLLA